MIRSGFELFFRQLSRSHGRSDPTLDTSKPKPRVVENASHRSRARASDCRHLTPIQYHKPGVPGRMPVLIHVHPHIRKRAHRYEVRPVTNIIEHELLALLDREKKPSTIEPINRRRPRIRFAAKCRTASRLDFRLIPTEFCQLGHARRSLDLSQNRYWGDSPNFLEVRHAPQRR